jgi:uncharacterized protein (UPF0332 family)
LATRKLGTSKHSGAIALFDKEFVKTGLLPRELSRSLRLAFDLRQTHDYGEIVEMDALTAQETMDGAKTFISTIEAYLQAEGFLRNINSE